MAQVVFISHASADEAIALATAIALDARGLETWIAARDIDRARGRFMDQVSEAMMNAAAVVQVVSSNLDDDPHATAESLLAVRHRIPIVEFIVDPAVRPRRREHVAARATPVESQAQRLAMLVRWVTAGRRGDAPENDERIALALVAQEEPAASDATLEEVLSPRGRVREPALGREIASRFRLDSRFGAELFRAHDVIEGGTALVKLFRVDGADPARVRELIEARLGAFARIDHPNVARLLGFGQANRYGDERDWYMATELVPGRDLLALARQMDHGPETVARRLKIARGLAHGLAALHEHRHADALGFERPGLIHGDIKATNVIVDPDDRPVLIDLLTVDGVDRPFGTLIGTRGYMAPELGQTRVMTTRTDLFALGVTFAVMFRPDLEGIADPEQLIEVLDEDLRIPSDFVELVRSLTDPEPDARLVSAAEAVDVLATMAPDPSEDRGHTVVPLPPRPHARVSEDPISWFAGLSYGQGVRADRDSDVGFDDDRSNRDRVSVTHWLGIQLEEAGSAGGARRLFAAADEQYDTYAQVMHGTDRAMVADPLDRCRLDVLVRRARLAGMPAEDERLITREALELALRIADTLIVGRTFLISDQTVFEVPVPVVPDPLDLLTDALGAYRGGRDLPAAGQVSTVSFPGGED